MHATNVCYSDELNGQQQVYIAGISIVNLSKAVWLSKKKHNRPELSYDEIVNK